MWSTVHSISVKFVLIELRNRRKRQKRAASAAASAAAVDDTSFSLFAAFVSNATQRQAAQRKYT